MAPSNAISRQLGKAVPQAYLRKYSYCLRLSSVSALGFGAMRSSALYGTLPSDEENNELIKLVGAVTHSGASISDFVILWAMDLDASLIDTANVGAYSNEAFLPRPHIAQCCGPPMISQDSIHACTS